MRNDVDWLIGLDIATSAVKAVLISARGEQRARGKRPTRFIRPQPDICEVDAEEHYHSVCELIRELASSLPSGDRVRALSMAFASGNTMLLDQALHPVGNIHFWLDNRKEGRTAELLPGFDPQAFQRINGWPYSELFPLSHIAWFRDNYPQQYKEGRVCMNSDYLMFRPQICRALMESVAVEMRRKIEQLELAGIAARRITMVGGPTRSPIWPRLVAEVTGLPLKLLNGQTAGAVGAAMLAAVGAGLYRDVREAFEAMGGEGTIIRPADAAISRYDKLYRQYVVRYAQ